MRTGSVDDGRFQDRLGYSLRREPWRWLLALVVAMAIIFSACADALGDRNLHAWADCAVAAFVAYGAIAVVVLVPRFVVPHGGNDALLNRTTVIRWSCALAISVIGLGGLALGAHTWLAGLAMVGSALALVYTALACRFADP
jgi:hypothetical protein